MNLRIPKISRAMGQIPFDWFKAIEDFCRAINPSPGRGLRITTTAVGTTFSVNPVVVPLVTDDGGGPTVNPVPFTCTLTTIISGDDGVNIQPGLCNQMLPDNMFDPDTSEPVFSLTGSLSYCYLDVQTDGKSVTSCSIIVDDGSGIPGAFIGNAAGAAPSEFFVLFAVIVGDAGSRIVYPLATGNVVAIPKQIVLVPKSGTIGAGQENFVRWWSWVVVQKP